MRERFKSSGSIFAGAKSIGLNEQARKQIMDSPSSKVVQLS